MGARLAPLRPTLMAAFVWIGASSCSDPMESIRASDADAGADVVEADAGADVVERDSVLRDVGAGRDSQLDVAADGGPEAAKPDISDRPVSGDFGPAEKPDGSFDDTVPPPACTQPSPNAIWEPVTLSPLAKYDAGFVLETGGEASAGGPDGGAADMSRDAAVEAPGRDVPVATSLDGGMEGGTADDGGSAGWMGTVIGLQALGPSSVWTLTSLVGHGSTLQHWDGARWTTIASSESQEVFTHMWATSDRDVWLVAFSPEAGNPKHFELRRWDGRSWRLAWSGPDDALVIASLWGLGPDDVWIVQGEFFHHWNGSTWASFPFASPIAAPSDAPPQEGRAGFSTMWGAASDDVWAAGAIQYPRFPNPNGDGSSGSFDVVAKAHWDGKAWTLYPPASVSSARLGMWMTLWGTSKSDVWAGGQDWTQGRPLLLDHYDGIEWRQVELLAEGTILSIWSDCGSNVWVAGGEGWDFSKASPMLFHFDGASWSRVGFPAIPAAAGTMFNVVSGTGPDDVWVGFGVGDGSHSDPRAQGGAYHLHP
jgi:hypothetical protein